MVTRRRLLGTAAGAGLLGLIPAIGETPAAASSGGWNAAVSANGWRIDPSAVAVHRIEGSAASIALHSGAPAAVLLHVARRWHYEIASLNDGEGGAPIGFRTDRQVTSQYESNFLSGTAMALAPTAYPPGGSESLWAHQVRIVRDILLDCEATVAWAGDADLSAPSTFWLVAGPRDPVLARLARRWDRTVQGRSRIQTAGAVADPSLPQRSQQATTLPRPRQ